MATLEEVNKKLTDQNEGLATINRENFEQNQDQLIKLNTQFSRFITAMKEGSGDRLEDSREAKQQVRNESRSPKQAKGGSSFNLFGLGNIVGTIAAIAAGATALLAALGGLRGWELGALKNIGKIGKALRALIPLTLLDKIVGKFTPEGFKTFSAYFLSKIGNLRLKTLQAFGFDTTLARFNDPASGLKKPLGAQILERVKKFRTGILNSIGIGADGKAIVVQGEDGKFKVPLAGRITGAIQDLLSPVVKLANGITGYVAGAGAKLFAGLATLGIVKAGGAAAGAVGGVLKLASKVLFPVAVVMSLFDGVTAYQEKEGSTFDKILAGAFGFIGDFIGAPLDLLKGAVSWLLRNALGVQVDEEGNVLPGQGLSGKVIDIINKFSFENMIKAIPEFFMKIFDSITAFFDNPIGVASDVIKGLVDTIKNMFVGVIKGVGKLFGFEPKTQSEKAQSVYESGLGRIGEYESSITAGGYKNIFGEGMGTQYLRNVNKRIEELRVLDPQLAEQLNQQRLAAVSEQYGLTNQAAGDIAPQMINSGNSVTNVDQGQTIIGGLGSTEDNGFGHVGAPI